MRNARWFQPRRLGSRGPALGSATLALVLGLGSVGCGSQDDTRILPPQQVAMDATAPMIYSDDEMTLFEVKKGIQFPIIAPEPGSLPAAQDGVYEPYGRMPWITLSDVRVQLTWTLSNLENRPHNVWLLVDPWTEFGRYWPGLTLVDADDGEYLPNRSVYEYYYSLEPTSAGERSRRHGTLTYDDMDEVARDFATIMNLIKFPPTTGLGGRPLEDGDDPLPGYVNHAVHFENRSKSDPLVARWIPSTVAALTGIDIGLRTADTGEQPGGDPDTPVAPKLALEVVVEITDLGTGKVRREGANDVLLEPTEELITVGVAP
jgi:hypothetical protein